MRAMQIANDALDSILNNLKIALRISIPIFLITLILSGLLGFDLWQALIAGDEMRANTVLQSNWWRIILVPLLVFVVSIYWITTAWHRFVILGEQPGNIFPKFHFGRIWAYIWRLVLLAVVIFLVMIVPLVILSLIFGAGSVKVGDYSEALAAGPAAIFVNFIGTIFFVYAFLRYSPFLVAAAIGEPIRAGTAREATFWARWDIFQISVGYAVITLVSAIIGTGVNIGIWPIELLVFLAINWVAFMFSISLITTLYQESVKQKADPDQQNE